jgi:hypothetical protein
MKSVAVRLVCIIISLYLVAPTSTVARIWHVPADALTIKASIDSAMAGDVVEIACGTYNESGLTITVPITLRSETGEPDCAVINGQSIATVLTCDWTKGSASIEGITVTGGHGKYTGGVLITGCASVMISDCILSDNHGGVMPGGGRGGGVGCFEQAQVTLMRCSLVDNSAYGGGGVYCEALAMAGLENCVLAGNDAIWGGGVDLHDDAACMMTNCTFYGNNSGAELGGGITNWSGNTVSVSNTIIAFSTTGSAVDGSLNLIACDLYGNADGDWIGDIADQLGVNCNICTYPLFCDPNNRNFTLAVDSPCMPQNNECGVLMGAFGEGCGPVAVAEEYQHAAGYTLQQNNPNPFNPVTIIRYDLAGSRRVTLHIYDVSGRLVRILRNAIDEETGRHEATWRGRDDSGRAVASGTYFYRLTAGDYVETKQMTLIR